jgi:hypothetical protein
VLAALNTASRRLRGGLRPVFAAAARGRYLEVQAGTEKRRSEKRCLGWFKWRALRAGHVGFGVKESGRLKAPRQFGDEAVEQQAALRRGLQQ